jgi:hypothetical protein
MSQSIDDGRSVGVFRRTIKDGHLPGGQIIPPGYMCMADVESVHMNPNTYPNPEVFDPFRFSKLREQGTSSDVKHLFTGTGKDVRFPSSERAVFCICLTIDWIFCLPSSYRLEVEDMFGESFDRGRLSWSGIYLSPSALADSSLL